MRKIFFKTTEQTAPIEVEVSDDVTTFGDLRREVANTVNLEGKRVIERNSKNTLEIDDAHLPPGDLFLFVFPKKVKAGARIDVEDMDYNELRALGSRLNHEEGANIDLSGRTEQVRERIQIYFDRSVGDAYEGIENDPDETVEEMFEEAKQRIINILEDLKETVLNDLPTAEQYFGSTAQQIEEEFNTLKGVLGV